MYVTIAGYKIRLSIRIGAAAAISNASIREKRIGDIGMQGRWVLAWLLAAKAWSLVVLSVT